MSYDKATVQQSIQDRQAFQLEDHPCPSCGEYGLMPCGGPGSYWIEHSCGAYSELKPTLAEALSSTWQHIDPDIQCHPPIGG